MELISIPSFKNVAKNAKTFAVKAAFLACLIPWLSFPNALAVTSSPNDDPVTASSRTDKPDSDRSPAEAVRELRQRQKKIQDVVAKNIGAVVAVTDGIGFGSGVIVNEDGLVLTAGHVMASSNPNYKVVLPSGKELRAKPLGKNKSLDAGMVQIVEEGTYPFVELGDKSELKLGDWCVCLGHPGGYKLGRTAPVRAGKILELNPNDLVTDCVLIGGDSGGPLFDLDGKLIGIHSSIGNHIAINRHVDVNTFSTYWDRLLKGERWGSLPDLNNKKPTPSAPPKRKTGKPALGVTIQPSETQALIIRVRPGSPAASVGIQVNDVVVKFEDRTIQSSEQLIQLIAEKNPGESVKLTTRRGQTEFHYQVVLGDLAIHN